MAITTLQTGHIPARLVRLLMAIALLAAFIALPAPVVAATDWYVATTGNDANDCMSAATPCMTIQAAINKASANDTINVAAGTYPEPAGGPLTINKTLTLLGAQDGVDARTRVGAESVITDPQGTSVIASGAVIDGFTVQDSVVAAFTGFGILINQGVSGTEIVNNIIQDNIVGIGLANSGASQAVIQHNLIRNNTRPGGASGSGIYTDQFSGGAIVRNVLIDENSFIGHSGFGGAINISNTNFATGGVFDLDVTSNLFATNSRAFVLFNTHNSLFDGNRITNSTFAASADVRLFDNNTILLFTNNDLSDGVGLHAVRFSRIFGVASSDVDFHQNNFERYGLTGMTVDPMSHTGTVDAECNWWNSPTGPTDPLGNPDGTGEEAVGDIDYTPWLTARAPGGACIGGVPSTPGKVTGGGQIGDSDPLFSPLGDLLSVPAILVSTSGGGEASFGFAISFAAGDDAPKGNLVYQDRSADVRIKATSFDQLIIDGGVCGPNSHATFTGMADVNGDPESLTVVVDDCGEGSTAPMPDTFSISTDSYSNGGPLIGGNIQIH